MFYRQIAIDAIEKAVAAANSSGMLEHAGLKGRLREIVVQELLRPFLNPHIKAATGTIVDQRGGQSRQVDIILYDEQVTPPILFSEHEGAIPCQSVVATIEVKSKLTRDELRRSVDNAGSVKRRDYGYPQIPFGGEVDIRRRLDEALLSLLPGDVARVLRQAMQNINSPACYVFAFTSDLSLEGGRKDEVIRLLQVVDESNRDAGLKGDIPIEIPISGLCVADRAFHWCVGPGPGDFHDELADSNQQQPLRNQPHLYWASHNVVLKFISNLMNTCSTFASQRWRIPLHVYFEPDSGERIRGRRH